MVGPKNITMSSIWVDYTGSRKEIHHNWTSPVDCIGWQDQHTTVLKNMLVTFSQESCDIYNLWYPGPQLWSCGSHTHRLMDILKGCDPDTFQSVQNILGCGTHHPNHPNHIGRFHAMLWGSRRNRHRSDSTGCRWNSSHHRCNGWLLPSWSKSALRPYWIPLPRLGWDG
jgi:hypothetical protein